jgi:hypothetical protein
MSSIGVVVPALRVWVVAVGTPSMLSKRTPGSRVAPLPVFPTSRVKLFALSVERGVGGPALQSHAWSCWRIRSGAAILLEVHEVTRAKQHGSPAVSTLLITRSGCRYGPVGVGTTTSAVVKGGHMVVSACAISSLGHVTEDDAW